MPDTKISNMTAVVTAAATDTFPVVQGGVNKRETLAQLAANGVKTETVFVNTLDVASSVITLNNAGQAQFGLGVTAGRVRVSDGVGDDAAIELNGTTGNAHIEKTVDVGNAAVGQTGRIDVASAGSANEIILNGAVG